MKNREQYTYTLDGSPLNYIYLPHLKLRSRLDQQIRLNSERITLQNQHTLNSSEPFAGPIDVEVLFHLDKHTKQKHAHYLPQGYTIYNLIRFVQKVSEGIIYTYNANIKEYNSCIAFDENPKTIITIRLDYHE